jgi:hypothetical protein
VGEAGACPLGEAVGEGDAPGLAVACGVGVGEAGACPLGEAVGEGDAPGLAVACGVGVGNADGGIALRVKATARVKGPGRSLFGSNCRGCVSGVLSAQLSSLVRNRGVSVTPCTEVTSIGRATG